MESDALSTLLTALRAAAPGGLAVGLAAGALPPRARGGLLLGALASAAAGFTAAALVAARDPDWSPDRPARGAAAALLAFGLAWTILRLGTARACPRPSGPLLGAILGLSIPLSGGLRAGGWLRSAPLGSDGVWSLSAGALGAALGAALAGFVAEADRSPAGGERPVARLALLAVLALLAAAEAWFGFARAELVALRGVWLTAVERVLRVEPWTVAGLLWATAALATGSGSGESCSAECPESSGAARRLALARRRRERSLHMGLVSLTALATVAALRDPGSARSAPPPPLATLLQASGGSVSIPLRTLGDGRVHRFEASAGPRLVRFLARKNRDGTYSAAFDACLLCGETYYVEERRGLVCLACDATVNPATLGKGGGCNPIPLRAVVRTRRADGPRLEVRLRDLETQAERFHRGREPAGVP